MPKNKGFLSNQMGRPDKGNYGKTLTNLPLEIPKIEHNESRTSTTQIKEKGRASRREMMLI